MSSTLLGVGNSDWEERARWIVESPTSLCDLMLMLARDPSQAVVDLSLLSDAERAELVAGSGFIVELRVTCRV